MARLNVTRPMVLLLLVVAGIYGQDYWGPAYVHPEIQKKVQRIKQHLMRDQGLWIQIFDQFNQPVEGITLNVTGGVGGVFGGSVSIRDRRWTATSDERGMIAIPGPLPINASIRVVPDPAWKNAMGMGIINRGAYAAGCHVKLWEMYGDSLSMNGIHGEFLMRGTQESPVALPVWRSQGLEEIPGLPSVKYNPATDQNRSMLLGKQPWGGHQRVSLKITGDGQPWPAEVTPYRVEMLPPGEGDVDIDITNSITAKDLDTLITIRDSRQEKFVHVTVHGNHGTEVAAGNSLYLAGAPKDGWAMSQDLMNFPTWGSPSIGYFAWYLKRPNGTYAAMLIEVHVEFNRDRTDGMVSVEYLGGYLNPTGSRNLEYFEAYNKMRANQRRDAIIQAELHERYTDMAKDLDYYRYFKLHAEKSIIEWMKKEGMTIPPQRSFEQIEREDPALAKRIFQNMSPENREAVLKRRKADEAAKPKSPNPAPAKP